MIKNPLANAGNAGFDPWVGKIPWRRAWQPTPVFLPEESHGQRSLAGYSPWGCRVGFSWATEHAHTQSLYNWGGGGGFLLRKTRQNYPYRICNTTWEEHHSVPPWSSQLHSTQEVWRKWSGVEREQQAEPTAAKMTLESPQPGEHEARDTPKQVGGPSKLH